MRACQKCGMALGDAEAACPQCGKSSDFPRLRTDIQSADAQLPSRTKTIAIFDLLKLLLALGLAAVGGLVGMQIAGTIGGVVGATALLLVGLVMVYK